MNSPREELQRDALGLVHSVVLGVAGSSPAFSISASLATLIAAVGVLAPASLLYCGLIVLGITIAYMNLNTLEANAGASYAWVSRVFHRDLGFIAGWSLLVASALFMVSAAIPAASATLLLLAPAAAQNKYLVVTVALLWLGVVTTVLVRGISITGRLQTLMTSIELGVLVLLGISAALHFGPVATRAASWQMFAPGQFDLSSFAAGAVVALYLFWGWDVALNLNEETRDAARTPGLGAALAMAVVIAAFTAYAVLILQALPDAAIHEAGTNILFVIAEQLLPRPWSYLAVLALMLSTVGTLQTCILQFSRTLFAKARDRKLHPRWAQVHPRWRTPHRATLLVSGLGAALLVLSVFFASIDAILKASINAIGVLAAVYYGLAGMACAWHFRHLARSAPGRFVGVVLWPAGSALAMWVCAGITLRDADGLTNAVTLVGLLAAGVPLAMQRRGRYE